MEVSRESIFISSWRSFCHAFFIIIGIFTAFIPLIFVLYAFSSDHEIMEKNNVKFLPDANGKKEILAATAPAILRIDVHGIIGKSNLKAEVVENQLIESRIGILRNNRIKGILLHFNTPGGGVNDSDGIYRLLMAYKEKYQIPVYAYIDGLCASGGVYIASAADRVYSNPVSVIGSVGVLLGPFFNAVGAMEKLGLKALTLTEGKNKDMLSPFRPWKEGEDESFKNIIDYFYNRFVSVVTSARHRLDRQKLIDDYGAQVFDPPTAEHLGYIDVANVNYNEALLALLKAARIDETKPYQVVELEPKSQWLADLIKGESALLKGKIRHEVQIGPKDLSELKDPFAYLYLPGLQQ